MRPLAHALLVLVLLVPVGAGAQDAPPMPSCEREAIGECVMFGGKEKTAEQRAADAAFIGNFETAEERRDEAVKYVFRGAEAIEAGDFRTAIGRYNQAWLLAPEAPRVYWGYALLMAARGDAESETRAMFDYAATLNDRNWRFFRDYGLWLGRIGDMETAIARFETAEALALEEDPALLMMLSMAHLRQENVAQARRYFDRAVTAGHPTDLDFIEAHEDALMRAETGE